MAGINNIIGNNPYNSFAIPEGVKSNVTKPENTTNVDKKTGADSKVGTDVSRNEYGDEFLRSSIVKNEDGAVYSKPRNVEADKAVSLVTIMMLRWNREKSFLPLTT